MNKKLLAEAISNQMEIDKKTSIALVEMVFELIKMELSKLNTVDINGFGKFEVKARSERQGFNPKTKEPITISATKIPSFRASKALKEAIK